MTLKKMFCLLVYACILLQAQTIFAQLKTYQFEQIDSLQTIEKRSVVVFIHTDWCKYCQVMKAKTLKNQEVVQLLNSKFYFVDFDAEEKRDVIFNDRVYKFKPNGLNIGIHELGTALATINSQVVYPTITILQSDFSMVFQKHSFFNSEELILILQKTK